MPFNIGTTAAKKVFWGTTEIKKIFSGTTQVWSSGEAEVYSIIGNNNELYVKKILVETNEVIASSTVAVITSVGQSAIAAFLVDNQIFVISATSTVTISTNTLLKVAESTTYFDYLHVEIGRFIPDTIYYLNNKIYVVASQHWLHEITPSTLVVNSKVMNYEPPYFSTIYYNARDDNNIYLVVGPSSYIDYMYILKRTHTDFSTQISYTYFNQPEQYYRCYGITTEQSSLYLYILWSNGVSFKIQKVLKSTMASVSITTYTEPSDEAWLYYNIDIVESTLAVENKFLAYTNFSTQTAPVSKIQLIDGRISIYNSPYFAGKIGNYRWDHNGMLIATRYSASNDTNLSAICVPPGIKEGYDAVSPEEILDDALFIYVIGAYYTGELGVLKIDKSTMTVAAFNTIPAYSVGIARNNASMDSNYIYITNSNYNTLLKISKSTLSIVATASNVASFYARALLCGSYIIAASGVSYKMAKFNISNFAITESSLDFAPYGKADDSNHFTYLNGSTLSKIRVSDFAVISTIPNISYFHYYEGFQLHNGILYNIHSSGIQAINWSNSTEQLIALSNTSNILITENYCFAVVANSNEIYRVPLNNFSINYLELFTKINSPYQFYSVRSDSTGNIFNVEMANAQISFANENNYYWKDAIVLGNGDLPSAVAIRIK